MFGWISYKYRLVYCIFDVLVFFKFGEINVICVEVGEGWYVGRLGFGGGRWFCFGDELVLFV